MTWLDKWLNRGVGYTWELGSFFDLDKERNENVEKLKALCVKAVNDLQPKDGKTFCNVAVRGIAGAMGCRHFNDGMLANDMILEMAKNTAFRLDNGERAQAHADKGGLAIAAKQAQPHGHVAVIYPMGALYLSGSWKKLVPYVAQVGSHNAIEPVSKAFPVSEPEPQYFLWGEA